MCLYRNPNDVDFGTAFKSSRGKNYIEKSSVQLRFSINELIVMRGVTLAWIIFL